VAAHILVLGTEASVSTCVISVPLRNAHGLVGTGTSIFTSVRAFLLLGLKGALNSLTETKNTWARDDPAIFYLLAGCLAGAYDHYAYHAYLTCVQSRVLRGLWHIVTRSIMRLPTRSS
jgi:hypothetical protein